MAGISIWKNQTIIPSGATVASFRDGKLFILGEDSDSVIHGSIFDVRVTQTQAVDVSGLIYDNFSWQNPIARKSYNGSVGVAYSLDFEPGDRDIYFRYWGSDGYGNGSSIEFVFSSADEALSDLLLDGGIWGNSADVIVAYSLTVGDDPSQAWLSLADFSGETDWKFRVDSSATETASSVKIAFVGSGDIAVVWQAFDPGTLVRTIKFTIVDEDGTAVSAERIIGNTGNPAFPTITALANGNAVIAWQDVSAQKMYYQVVGADGNDVTVLRSVDDAFGIVPKLVATPDGGFVLAWSSYAGTEGDGSPDGDVVIQMFDASGTFVSDFEIDNPGDQSLSDLTVTEDGRIVVVYNTETGDSTDTFQDAFMILDPRGRAITGDEGNNVIVGGLGASVISGLEGDDQLYGMNSADTLIGGDGNDRLDGGTGNDVMVGGNGDDTYYVDGSTEFVVEVANGGADRVFASVSFGLAGTHVENLTLTGTSNINATGNSLANIINGNAGNNIIDGGTGIDVMSGGKGNDVYIIDRTGDTVTETTGNGTDRIESSVNYSLAGIHVENLTLTGTLNIQGTGNSLDNAVVGNAANNVLDGAGGNDKLKGAAGADTLTGGTGTDQFIFTSLSESTVASSGRDLILDFARTQGDRVNLSVIDANTALAGDQAFTFVGAASFSNKAGELRYAVSGGDTFIEGDVDGNGTADFSIVLDRSLAMVGADFVL